MQDALLTHAEVADYFGVSQMTIRRWRETSVIPAPITIGPRLTRWRQRDLDAYVQSLQPSAA